MNTSLRLTYFVLAATCSFSAFSADSTPEPSSSTARVLEVNNKWDVTISNNLKFNAPLYVTLKNAVDHWEIVGLFESPPKLTRSQDLELFIATRDFQQWTNFYNDMRTDCDKFEVRESEHHSVCTSSLAEKKTGLAIAKLFFGGNGNIPFAYTDGKVKAAINSIRPQQAAEMLTAFEQGSLNSQEQAHVIAAKQQQEHRQLEETQVAARKSAPIGAKDWCEQTVKYFGRLMQIEQTYTCQNYGVVTEDNLRSEGWAIVIKKERKIGYAPLIETVHDIAIEKVPR